MQNSPARSTIDVGSVIAGTYTIEALIGRGGMGAVFMASHARLPGKKVAIKVLHAELSGDEVLARFKREAQIASLLSHPNIVHIEDYNVTPEGMPYLVLEYLKGESLAQRLQAGPLSVEQAFSIIRQVGSALAAAHAKGIVHRDLKPQNIFLVPSEIEGRTIEIAKVLDFGISKMRDSQTVKTQDSALLGTPQYMAPEQATGQHSNVDERTDVFALGAIVYEMLSGNPAFSGASIPEVVFKVVYEQPTALAQRVPSLPAAIADAVHRAMAKASAERYSTVSAFIEALTGTPLNAPRSISIPPPMVGFAAGSRGPDDTALAGSGPSTAREAYAQTIGSGNHGASPVAVDAATVASHNAAIAGTVASSPPPPVSTTSQPATTSPPAATAAPPLVLAEPARPKRGVWIAAVFGVAAIGGGAAFFAMKGGSESKQVASEVTPVPERVAVEQPPTPAPPPVEPAPVQPPPAESPVDKPADQPADKPADKPVDKPAAKKPTKPAPDDKPVADQESAEPETWKAKLRDAEVARNAGNWSRAEQLSNAVINSEDATPRQKAMAHLTLGTVQCTGRNNEEAAVISLRQLKAFPMLRRQLVRVCRDAGFLRNER